MKPNTYKVNLHTKKEFQIVFLCRIQCISVPSSGNFVQLMMMRKLSNSISASELPFSSVLQSTGTYQ